MKANAGDYNNLKAAAVAAMMGEYFVVLLHGCIESILPIVVVYIQLVTGLPTVPRLPRVTWLTTSSPHALR
jgi:hypothetical protein